MHNILFVRRLFISYENYRDDTSHRYQVNRWMITIIFITY